MKATELRIGNIIAHVFSDHTDIVEVEEIRADSIHAKVIIQGGKQSLAGHCEQEGVAITEEWLLRFGFEKNIENPELFRIYTDPTQALCVALNGDCFLYDKTPTKGQELSMIILPEIFFIHQIQNLFFCLCWEELTLQEAPLPSRSE